MSSVGRSQAQTTEAGLQFSGLAKFAWLLLAYNVGVIIWGAYVRVTGSGAGCGNHWPLCNGEVIPRAAQVQTLIEFTHRVSSGIALLSVVLLWFLCRRSFPKGHLARYGALATVILMLNEALLGASLVLFEHVAQDKSLARSVSLSLHFANTLLLLGALTLTAQWISQREIAWDGAMKKRGVALGIALLGIILAGATGAIAALGDTLFRPTSLASSITQDFSRGSHYLLRLRLIHPAVAFVVVLYLVWLLARSVAQRQSVRPLAILVIGLSLLQFGLGLLNVVLLAPVWMQLLHLLVADTLWIALVLFAWHSIERRTLSRAADIVPANS